MGPTKDVSSTNATQTPVTSSYGRMRQAQRCRPLPAVPLPAPLWASGTPLWMASGMEALERQEERSCAAVTRLQSLARCRRTVPTRAGRSIPVANPESSSVASSSGLTKMCLHKVLLAVVSAAAGTAAAGTAAVASAVVRAAAAEVDTAERRREIPALTELPPRRNHGTAASVTCPDTRESPVHSGDVRRVFAPIEQSAFTVSFNTSMHDSKCLQYLLQQYRHKYY